MDIIKVLQEELQIGYKQAEAAVGRNICGIWKRKRSR